MGFDLARVGCVLAVLGFLAACGNESRGLTPCRSQAQCRTTELCLIGVCVHSLVSTTPAPGDSDADGGPLASLDGGPIRGGGVDGSVPRDTGMPDAGQPDAGQPKCLSPDCNLCEDLHPDAVICENFDDEVAAPWIPGVGPGGSLGINDIEFLAGGGALRVTATPGPGSRYVQSIEPPITTGDIYARTYVFVPESSIPGGFLVVVNLDDGIDSGTNDKLSLDLNGSGGFQVIRAGGPQVPSAREVIAPNRWHCLEFHYRIAEDDAPGATSLFIDGQLAAQLAAPQLSAPTDGFGRLSVGIVSSGTDNPSIIEVLLDEFVLTTEGAVGCVP